MVQHFMKMTKALKMTNPSRMHHKDSLEVQMLITVHLKARHYFKVRPKLDMEPLILKMVKAEIARAAMVI